MKKNKQRKKAKQMRPPVFDEAKMLEVASKLISSLSDEEFSALTESDFNSLCAKRYHQMARDEAAGFEKYASSRPFTNAARQLVRG